MQCVSLSVLNSSERGHCYEEKNCWVGEQNLSLSNSNVLFFFNFTASKAISHELKIQNYNLVGVEQNGPEIPLLKISFSSKILEWRFIAIQKTRLISPFSRNKSTQVRILGFFFHCIEDWVEQHKITLHTYYIHRVCQQHFKSSDFKSHGDLFYESFVTITSFTIPINWPKKLKSSQNSLFNLLINYKSFFKWAIRYNNWKRL